jgi:hypothetical protein
MIKGYKEDLLHATEENYHNVKIFFFSKKVKVHSFIMILFGYQHSHSGGLHARPAALLRRHQSRSSAVFRRFFDTWS